MHYALIAASLLPASLINELSHTKQKLVPKNLFVFNKKCISFECADGSRVVSPAQFAAIQEQSGTIKNFVKDAGFNPADGKPLPLPTVSTEQFDLLFGISNKKSLSQKQWAQLIAAAECLETPVDDDAIASFAGVSNAVLLLCTDSERQVYQQFMERIKSRFYFFTGEMQESGWHHSDTDAWPQQCAEYYVSRYGDIINHVYRTSMAVSTKYTPHFFNAIKGVHGRYGAVVDEKINIFTVSDGENYLQSIEFPGLFIEQQNALRNKPEKPAWGASYDKYESTHLFAVGKKIYCIFRHETDPSKYQWYSMDRPWSTKEQCVLTPCAGVVLKESRLFVPQELAGDLECEDMPSGDLKKNLPYNILPCNEKICFLSDHKGFRLFFNKRSEKSVLLAHPCTPYSEDFSELAYVAADTPYCVTIMGKDFTQKFSLDALTYLDRSHQEGFLGSYDSKAFLLGGNSNELCIVKKIAHCDPRAASAIWSKRFPHDEHIRHSLDAQAHRAKTAKSVWQSPYLFNALLIAGCGMVAYKASPHIFSFFNNN